MSDAVAGGYDVDERDARARSIDVTKNELVSSRLLVPSLGGYGFQFNGHLYAPITNPPPATLPDLESKVKALEPQLVRIFYNENWEANANNAHPEWPQNLESFKDTVALAERVGRDDRRSPTRRSRPRRPHPSSGWRASPTSCKTSS